jgi:hypothetical protein
MVVFQIHHDMEAAFGICDTYSNSLVCRIDLIIYWAVIP